MVKKYKMISLGYDKNKTEWEDKLISEKLLKIRQRIIEEIYKQRESICKAFIAETGLLPSE